MLAQKNLQPYTIMGTQASKVLILGKNYLILLNTAVQILFPKSKIILSGGGLPSSYRIDNIHFHWGGEHTIASEQR